MKVVQRSKNEYNICILLPSQGSRNSVNNEYQIIKSEGRVILLYLINSMFVLLYFKTHWFYIPKKPNQNWIKLIFKQQLELENHIFSLSLR